MAAAAVPEPLLDERFEHPEGVVWDARRERLLWVDGGAGRVLSCDAGGGGLVAHELGRFVGAVAPRAAGGLVCALREGFALLSDHGEETMVDDLLRATPLRMNDGGVDPRGRFWAGSMAWEDGGAPDAKGALYRLDADGTVTTHVRDVGISNGVGWSPDGTRCYYNDTLTGRVDVFDYDLDAGALSGRRPLAEIAPPGMPDGLAVDADGCVWVALWGGWEVHRITPGGVVDRVVRLPGAHVATCAFGGPGLRTLYISVSQQDLSAQERREQQAGYVFALDVGVAGLPTHEYAG